MMRAMKVGWGVGLLLISALLRPAAAQTKPTVVEIPRQIPAYSVTPPHDQKGFFPAGSRLGILGPTDGLVRVRFETSAGRIVEGLCRGTDLGLGAPAAPPPAPVQKVGPGPRGAASIAKWMGAPEYKEREWLEDAAGHDAAVELQAKFKTPLLIYFYADWNDDCQFVWEQLLNNIDFKNQTKNIIKLRINPEHGKAEGRLANQYRLRRYPTTMVIDQPRGGPRIIELVYWSFGRERTPTVEYAIAEIMGAVTNTNPWQAKQTAPAAP